jgi:alanyl-tRNA synthetase
LETLPISTVKKQELREVIASTQKNLFEAEKNKKANELKLVMEKIEQLCENKEDFIIARFDNIDSKNLVSAINFAKTKTKAALFLNVASDKVMHSCFVSKELSTNKCFSAAKWANCVAEKVGGRSGGKEEAAQGAGENVMLADAAMEVANEFARLKLNS